MRISFLDASYDEDYEDYEDGFSSALYNLSYYGGKRALGILDNNKTAPIEVLFDALFIEDDMGIVFGYTLVKKELTDYSDVVLQGSSGPCHAGLGGMGRIEKNEKIILVSWLRHDSTPYEDAKEYWDAIFDPSTSPWKGAINGFEYIKNKKGKAVAFKIEILSTMSPQLVAGLAIASRFVFEHPYMFKLFKCLTGFGLSKKQALLGSYLGTLTSFDKEVDIPPSIEINHHPISFGVSFNVNRFMNNDPLITDSTYEKGSLYHGTSHIFNDDDDERNTRRVNRGPKRPSMLFKKYLDSINNKLPLDPSLLKSRTARIVYKENNISRSIKGKVEHYTTFIKQYTEGKLDD